ncbi:MAG TPA: phage portal protein, partial [Clostridia bacterium]|nr:phage portal protein [Clostridia bacterium]
MLTHQSFHMQAGSAQKVDEHKALQLSAVYACIRILSETVACLPIGLYKRQGKNSDRAFDHPLDFLLHDEPNEDMTSFDFIQTLMVQVV